jgi:predicted nucleic acid-binding protein
VVEVTGHVEPKDAPIVAAAIIARAYYLVTYDRRHLLRQAELIFQRYGIETVRPGVVLARLANR